MMPEIKTYFSIGLKLKPSYRGKRSGNIMTEQIKHKKGPSKNIRQAL